MCELRALESRHCHSFHNAEVCSHGMKDVSFAWPTLEVSPKCTLILWGDSSSPCMAQCIWALISSIYLWVERGFQWTNILCPQRRREFLAFIVCLCVEFE